MLSGGYLLWANVINRLRDWIHLRVVSSFRTCATWAAKIFSRAERSWILQSTSSISDIQRARLEMVFYNLPNHCNTNGPRWVANGKLEIWVLRISVKSALHTMRYFRNSGKNIGLHGLESARFSCYDHTDVSEYNAHTIPLIWVAWTTAANSPLSAFAWRPLACLVRCAWLLPDAHP